MFEREFFRVRDNIAVKPVKGKKVYIDPYRKHDDDGVVTIVVHGDHRQEGWRYLRTDLEPWVEPTPKENKKLAKEMEIKFLMAIMMRHGSFEHDGLRYSTVDFAADRLKKMGELS